MTGCSVCGSGVLVEITSYGDADQVFLCRNGHRSSPVRRVDCMGLVAYGPPVPTPDDILRGAGFDDVTFRG